MKKEFIVAVGNSTRYGMPRKRLWWFNGSNNLFSDLKSGALNWIWSDCLCQWSTRSKSLRSKRSAVFNVNPYLYIFYNNPPPVPGTATESENMLLEEGPRSSSLFLPSHPDYTASPRWKKKRSIMSKRGRHLWRSKLWRGYLNNIHCLSLPVWNQAIAKSLRKKKSRYAEKRRPTIC